MRRPAQYALAVALAAVFLSCKGPAGPTGPQESAGPPAKAERPAAPAALLPGYEKTITVTAVRVTNTDGGNVLTVTTSGKPVIVHVEVDNGRTDLAALKEAGAELVLSMFFDGFHAAPVEPWLQQPRFTAEMLERNEPATVLLSSVKKGQWRNQTLRLADPFVGVPSYEDDGTFYGWSQSNAWTVATPPDEYRIGPVDVVATTEKTITVTAVRVTNTSGGTVLVAAPWPARKPVIVHVDVNVEESHLPALKEAGGTLDLSLSVDGEPFGAPRALTPLNDASVSLTADMLEKNEPAAAWLSTNAVTGQWRERELSYEASVSLEGWRLVDLNWAKRKYAVDVVIPYPSDMVFHPVVTDAAQIPRETEKLESHVLANGEYRYGSFLHEWRDRWTNWQPGELPLYDYTPLVIGEHRIGPAVVVDTTKRKISVSSALDALESSYGTGDFDWDGTYKDFRVAVVSEEVHDGPDFLGVARFHKPFSSIRLQTDNPVDDFYSGSLWALIHEMGHNLGLLHVHDDAGGRDPNYPDYPDGNINEDAYWVDADGRVVTLPREDYYDFMGYNSPDWISAYHYRKMAEYAFGIEPTLEARRPVVTAP